MIRVLNVTECMQAAGIESFIMNVYRRIDKNKIQFDFMVMREEKEYYEDEILKLGGKKYSINRMYIKSTLFRVLMETIDLYKFLKKNNYEVIQIHTGTPLRVFYLIAAKRAGVKMRIYHSHSAEVKGVHKGKFIKKKVFNILKLFISKYATNLFACSRAAGIWMYRKKDQKRVEIINNAIDINKFKFDADIRNIYRKNMKVTDCTVIGHVARFNHQKNHTFLIDAINEVIKENPKIVLWLIGNGKLENEIKEKVKKLNLEKNVFFLGIRDDVNCLMQAMDMFVLPSNYEGLPVVGIEAQASGLDTLFSTSVTNEVCITQNCYFLELDVDKWKNRIIELSKMNHSRDTVKYVKENGYDIMDTVEKLTIIYLGVKSE